MTTAKDKDVLDVTAIEDALTELPGWEYKNSHLYKQYLCKSFQDAMDFANDVAKIATEMNHHPDMLVSFRKIKFMCCTHKLEALTSVDVELARRIERCSDTQGLEPV